MSDGKNDLTVHQILALKTIFTQKTGVISYDITPVSELLNKQISFVIYFMNR